MGCGEDEIWSADGLHPRRDGGNFFAYPVPSWDGLRGSISRFAMLGEGAAKALGGAERNFALQRVRFEAAL